MRIVLIISFAFVTLILSCTKDVTEIPKCPEVISFSTTIKPLIEQNCSTSGCHDATAQGGINLETHVGISTNAEGILNVIQLPTNDPKFMPQGGEKLEDSLIQQFSCWTDQGKLNN